MPVKLHDEAVDNQAAKQNATNTTSKIRFQYIVYVWYHIPGIRVGEATPSYEYEYVPLFRTSVLPH